jgi:hypothetical protein
VSLAIQIAVLTVPPLATTFAVTMISPGDWLVMGVASIALFAIMKSLNPLLDKFGPEYSDQKSGK